MLTFKQFLKENKPAGRWGNIQVPWKITPILKDESITKQGLEFIVKDKIGESAVKSLQAREGVLFRGFAGGNSLPYIFEIDTTGSKRHSKDTNNVYQLLLQNTDSFKDVPDRSSSLICTTDVNRMTEFGTPYIVIPHPSVKEIAYIEEEDIFHARIDAPDIIPQQKSSPEKLSKNFAKFLAMVDYSEFGQYVGWAANTNNKITDVDKINKSLSKLSPKVLGFLWVFAFTRSSTFKLLLSSFDAQKDIDSWNRLGSFIQTLVNIKLAMELDDTVTGFHDSEFKEAVEVFLNEMERGKLPDTSESKFIEKLINNFAKVASSDRSNIFGAIANKLFNKNTIQIHVASSPKNIPQDVEAWFSGKALCIRYDLWLEIYENI